MKTRLKLTVASVLLIIAYILGMTLLMYVNTALLDKGDPKFGTNGWRIIYSQAYIVCYSPVLLVSIAFVIWNRVGVIQAVVIYCVLFVLVLLIAEFDFLTTDGSTQTLIFAQLFLVCSVAYVSRRLRPSGDSQTDSTG